MSVGRIQRYGLPYANVVATGVATNQIVTQNTLENIQLKLGGTSLTKAMISDIKVKAGSRVIFNTSGSQLDKLNAFRGETTEAAYLDIPFLDFRGLTEADRMVGALDAALIGYLSTEVTIAGATAPTLGQVLFESPSQSDASTKDFAGLIHKVLRYPFNTATGGQININLPFGELNGAFIKRIHVEHGGNMTALEIKQNSMVIHESIAAENAHELKRWGLVPQTNWYSVDFVMDGNFRKWLNTRDARTLEVLPTFSAADSGYVIVEFIDPLGNL